MGNHSAGFVFAWQIAAAEAISAHCKFIEPEHLFIGLCKLESFATEEQLRVLGIPKSEIESLVVEIKTLLGLFSRFNCNPKSLRRELRKRIGSSSHDKEDHPDEKYSIHRSQKCRKIFMCADEVACKRNVDQTNSCHLLAALLEDPESNVVMLLQGKGVHVKSLRDAALATQDTVTSRPTEIATPGVGKTLARYGKDLTELAHQGKIYPAIGRKNEMLQIVRTLSRATKNNPLLLGDPGVGKTAIVEGLALRIAQGNVPDIMRGKRIIQANLADLVAGTKYRGEFEERLQEFVHEVVSALDVIIFIDEIHTLIGAGKGHDAAMDAANILKPALARGELRCIGATTRTEYHKYIEKDPALERRFQPISVDEPSPEETTEILRGVQPRLEQQHGATIDDGALQTAIRLAIRYLPDRRLPDKAIDLLDEACARSRITRLTVSPRAKSPDNRDTVTVTAETVADVVSEWTGIPAAQLTGDERSRLLKMAETLKERVIGQDEAVQAVVETVQHARTGLKTGERPIGVLLFLGPTGSGKTELAKATANFLFASDSAMVRLDMSEFHERHTASRLLGSPPGYIGSEDEGQLTGALRRTPYCIVLLDEIEKAHPDVLNLFLQVFEDGRLTDAKGRTVDASNAFFIMTSNIGFPRARRQPIGFQPQSPDTGESPVPSELQAAFRPEFLNRIDRTIVFHPLQPTHIESIARLRLRSLADRLAEQGIGLQVREAAIELLTRLGYDEQYGARPLRRMIEQRIEKMIGDRLLRGDLRSGHIVIVDAQADEIVINNIGTETV